MAARPRQRSYGSTTEKIGGNSGVYGRHQFRMRSQFLKDGIIKRKREMKKRWNVGI